MAIPYPIQFDVIQDATGVPRKLLEDCPFTRYQEPTYGLWNVCYQLGYKNRNVNQLKKMDALSKVMAVAIEYLKKHRQLFDNLMRMA